MKKVWPNFITETDPYLGQTEQGKPRHVHRIKDAEAVRLALHGKRRAIEERADVTQKMREREMRMKELTGKMEGIQGLSDEYDFLVEMHGYDASALELLDEQIATYIKEVREHVDEQFAQHEAAVMERWELTPYAEADIKKYFSEEYLAKLSIEDYALLLRRFPGELVTHVTRQGVRDRISHHSGAGGFYNGFEQTMRAGRLQSVVGRAVTQEMKEAAIVSEIKDIGLTTKEAAFSWVQNVVNPEGQGKPGVYSDINSVHFAANEVADSYYGAEQGNEIFFVFPAMFIATAYHHSGGLADSGGGYWNDLWVWDQENRGINVDAGVVFIPADARVDPHTGSRYLVDAEKNPEMNDGELLLADKTISSREYWEQYFAQHPELRPSKIVYYEGGDPTAALKSWKQKNRIANGGRARNALFDSQKITRRDPVAMQGAERFLSVAESVIEKYFEATDRG